MAIRNIRTLGDDILRAKAKEITDKPIGVNVMLLSEHVDEVAQVVA